MENPRDYLKWSKEEDENLLAEYTERMPIDEIAETHQRSIDEIQSRLKTLGLISD